MSMPPDTDRATVGNSASPPNNGGRRVDQARAQLVAVLRHAAIPCRPGVARLLWPEADGTVRALDVTRPLTLGSDPGCDGVFPFPGVSPLHCLLGPSGHLFEIVDLGSASGTYVNGNHVGLTLSPLRAGDTIEIGSVTAVFVA